MIFSNLSFAEASRKVGSHAIIRDDPYFGRRGLVKRVIADESHGFLVLVLLFKTYRVRGNWELLDRPPPDARKYWQPGRVELLYDRT